MKTFPQETERLQLEIREHQQALCDFIASAEKLAADVWNVPTRGDKWSPAQVAEHLRLSYTTVRDELSGLGGFRVRTKWWQQKLFRFLYLPKILRSGHFPRGVLATREIRPGDGPFDRQQLLGALSHQGEQVIQDISSAPVDRVTTITHPFLGKLGLLDGLRFTTQHIRHHHSQIIGVPSGPH